MDWIGWDERYATGHAGMDHGHKKLMDLINQLADGMENDESKESCSNILAQFIEQASIHFAHEEQLMDRLQYPRAAEHKAVHATMLNDVLGFKASYDASDTTEFITLLVVLDSWLKRDIEAADKALVAFVNAASSPSEPARVGEPELASSGAMSAHPGER
jgi:hemerythrin